MSTNVSSKVTAASIAAAASGYIVSIVADHLSIAVPADIVALLQAAITAAVVFAAGFAKRELAKAVEAAADVPVLGDAVALEASALDAELDKLTFPGPPAEEVPTEPVATA